MPTEIASSSSVCAIVVLGAWRQMWGHTPRRFTEGRPETEMQGDFMHAFEWLRLAHTISGPCGAGAEVMAGRSGGVLAS